VTEASAELARLGDEAKVYAGGTEIIPLLRRGLVPYTHLVDIKRIPELGELA
jgi:CO/xanthine dehydrogenase FAD-binding subunit